MNYSKRIIRIIIAILFVIIVLIIGYKTVSLKNEQSAKQYVSSSVADVSSGTVEEYSDTHGGFLGDGDTFIKIKFYDGKCLNSIKNSDAWKKYPLTDSLETFIYGKDYTVGDTVVSEGPMISEDISIPKVKNGYYYFLDRGDGKLQPKKTAENVLGAFSYNITFAIYDTNNNILYYYELDT